MVHFCPGIAGDGCWLENWPNSPPPTLEPQPRVFTNVCLSEQINVDPIINWFGLAWLGLVWFGLVWSGLVFSPMFVLSEQINVDPIINYILPKAKPNYLLFD